MITDSIVEAVTLSELSSVRLARRAEVAVVEHQALPRCLGRTRTLVELSGSGLRAEGRRRREPSGTEPND